MVKNDQSRFIINSDYPMPAEVERLVATVEIPAGVDVLPTNRFFTEIRMSEESEMYRISIQSSRSGNRIYVGDEMSEYYDDAYYSCWVTNSGNNTLKCRVNVQGGNVTSTQTQQSNTITFYISCFKVP